MIIRALKMAFRIGVQSSENCVYNIGLVKEIDLLNMNVSIYLQLIFSYFIQVCSFQTYWYGCTVCLGR